MLKELVKKSRSYRRFDEKFKISKETLVELIELARFSPSMRNQQALKFILSYDPEKNNLIFPALAWAGALKDWKGPAVGERPTAYIVVLGDRQTSLYYGPDHGIAAQSILLGATEIGLGGCMIGSVNRRLLRKNLSIPIRYQALLVIALGKPAEKIILEDLKDKASTKYYRDKNDYHHVPKRKIEELIVG